MSPYPPQVRRSLSLRKGFGMTLQNSFLRAQQTPYIRRDTGTCCSHSVEVLRLTLWLSFTATDPPQRGRGQVSWVTRKEEEVEEV
ncbi:hypothetical protein SKAU_G00080750 [Synaphobranchus kaupii]|uniref:Uncharacterized protein n=1 Tax=Synaphobranchus kaupii TaxID=118154 RepID=A0A9Q1FV27_SYNKA|nr:hypothetical protein SKAU_G00080750 [Synaphobranchus kaupii]